VRGERLLIPCEGGPSMSRLVHEPAPLEIVERGGLYVLDDTDPGGLRYVWMADST
jgi:hypothetical protein